MIDAAQIIKDCYDPTAHALRVTYTDPDVVKGLKIDANHIIKALYVPALHALRIADPIAGSGTYGTCIDGNQVIKMSFNATTGKLRVVG